MTSFGDLLGNADKEKLFKNSLNKGDVFLKQFEAIDHLKFFIVVGLCDAKLFLCSVYINSNIHPSIMSRQHLLELQVPIKKSNNHFLKHDSFACCSTHIPMESELVGNWVSDKSCKVIGAVHPDDLINITKALIASDLLTEEEIELYF